MSLTRNDDFRESFFQECDELLEAMQDGFDALVDDSHDSETMNAIFRAVHSIKGGAGAFRLDNLVGFAHHFETALDKLRSGQLKADESLRDLLRQSGDHLSDLVEISRTDGDAALDTTDGLKERLSEVFGLDDDPGAREMPAFKPVALDLDFGPAADDRAAPTPPGPAGFTVGFQPEPGLFASGNEPVLLVRALERLGSVEVGADFDAVPPLSELDPTTCHIGWTFRVETDAPESEIRDVFEFVDGNCRLKIAAFENVAAAVPAVRLPDLPEVPQAELPSLDDLIGTPETTTATPAANARAEKPSRNDERKPAGAIRVDLEKVDKLINLVGELVIKEAMLSQSISGFQLPSESEVSVALESLKQLAGEIQEGVMAIRAQPVKPMFQRMSRIVREASAVTGKPVRFITDGEYTEVDKTVVERLIDPLTHMIRNAIDHGLESPESRTALGKAAEGTITLTAAHRSGRVIIDVSDDGAGINRDRVRQAAIDRGLVAENADLSPLEIDNLLFLPGFSLKQGVSELSGRGVGLDVVGSEITGLGGRVSIRSTPGSGTTFSISLPLTLAVLEGMVIKVADQTMVVPISAIQETLQPRPSEIDSIGQNIRVLRNRNGVVPIVDLGLFFGFRAAPAALEHHVLLLIETGNHRRFALVVDEIQDQRQVVIKSLETNYRQVGGVAAATILGDGRIALIIDPDNIITQARSNSPVELTVS